MRRVRAAASSVLSVVLVAYLGICALLYAKQNSLVYFPVKPWVSTPEDHGMRHEDVRLAAPDGAHAADWWIPGDEAKPTILFFHGNAENVSGEVFVYERLHHDGFPILAADYRGYGKGDGRPDEHGLEIDAEAAWDWLVRTRGVDPSRIVIWGHSLGGGVAGYLAHEHRARAVVLDSTFTSVPDIGALVYWWLPVRLLATNRFPTLERVRTMETPVVVAHSPQDDVVPYEMGRRLFAAARPKKLFVELRGRHNDAIEQTPGAIEKIDAWVIASAGTITAAAAR